MAYLSGLAAAAKVAIYGTIAADSTSCQSAAPCATTDLHAKDNAAMVSQAREAGTILMRCIDLVNRMNTSHSVVGTGAGGVGGDIPSCCSRREREPAAPQEESSRQ